MTILRALGLAPISVKGHKVSKSPGLVDKRMLKKSGCGRLKTPDEVVRVLLLGQHHCQ